LSNERPCLKSKSKNKNNQKKNTKKAKVVDMTWYNTPQLPSGLHTLVHTHGHPHMCAHTDERQESKELGRMTETEPMERGR